MAPDRRDGRLGFKNFERGCWEVLLEDSVAIEEENVRSKSPLPPCVPGAGCGLNSALKNDDLSAEIAGDV